MKVLIAEKIGEPGVRLLRDAGLEVDLASEWGDGVALEDRIGEYEGILIRSATKLNADLLEKATSLRAVGRAGVGVDNVDKHGTPTERLVEPVMFLAREEHWYLVGWCRLRDELRAFRLDRVVAVHDTGESVPERPAEHLALPCHVTQVTAFA